MERCNSFETQEHIVKNTVAVFDDYKLSKEQEEIIKKKWKNIKLII